MITSSCFREVGFERIVVLAQHRCIVASDAWGAARLLVMILTRLYPLLFFPVITRYDLPYRRNIQDRSSNKE